MLFSAFLEHFPLFLRPKKKKKRNHCLVVLQCLKKTGSISQIFLFVCFCVCFLFLFPLIHICGFEAQKIK